MMLLLTLSVLLFSCPTVPFEQKFKLEYEQGLAYLDTHGNAIGDILKGREARRQEMLAIVFPELIRYSMYRDFFETKSLELGYVNFGSGFVDFSIGRFQMKPSFVEALEAEILKLDNFKSKYRKVLTAKGSSETCRRQERVKRLSCLAGQLLYLSCFYDLMEHKYRFHSWSSNESRLRFYATAYNHGFTADPAEILKWEHAQTFPFGMSYKGTQYNYADVSLHFYRNNAINKSALN